MSRTIKFRAWSGKIKAWVKIENACCLHSDGTLSVLDGFKVQQSTGEHDKKFKDIYEGDIINVYGVSIIFKNPDEGKLTSVQEVYWNEDEFAWYTRKSKDSEFPTSLGCYLRNIEVIGNIFENPELIK